MGEKVGAQWLADKIAKAQLEIGASLEAIVAKPAKAVAKATREQPKRAAKVVSSRLQAVR